MIMNNLNNNRNANNYNYNPSLNIPTDKIKPVNCMNTKIHRQSKGKVMVHCISAIPEANGRCKEELRVNYLKGIIQKKVQNDKYRHLLNIQLPPSIHVLSKETLVPSQYLQPGRINNNNTEIGNMTQNLQSSQINYSSDINQRSNNPMSILTTSQSHSHNINMVQHNSNNNSFQNNPFLRGTQNVGSNSNNNYSNNSGTLNTNTNNTNTNNTNPFFNNKSQNYSLTNNQQFNQAPNQTQNMIVKVNNFLQNAPTLQRGNTFGATNTFNGNNNYTSPFSQQKPLGNFQQSNVSQQNIQTQNLNLGANQPNTTNIANPFSTMPPNNNQTNPTNQMNSFQSTLNQNQTINNNNTANMNGINGINGVNGVNQQNSNQFGFLQQNQNQNTNQGNGQGQNMNMNMNTMSTMATTTTANGFNQNFNNMNQNQTTLFQTQTCFGNNNQNNSNPLFNLNQTTNQAPNQTMQPNQTNNNLTTTANTQNIPNQQAVNYSLRYPVLYKLKQQQLNKLKENSIKDQNNNNFNIQSLNIHLRDYQNNKFNIWNQITLNQSNMSQNNEQGRRYITHVLKRMIDQKMVDQSILKESITTLYKFIYGENVYNQMVKQYQKQGSNSTNSTISGIQKSPFLDFVSQQPKNVRLDSILGKSTDQNNYSVRGRFSSLENFDEKVLFQTTRIRNNLENSLRQQQSSQQQQQKQFHVRFIPQKKQPYKMSSTEVNKLQKIGQSIKKERQQTFRSIMVSSDQLPVVQDYDLTPTISQLSRYMKNQIKSVPHVKIQNQWAIAQFLAPISLYKKNVKQCIRLGQNQIFISDQEWEVRLCRVTFKRFADFRELSQQEQNDLQERIFKWCKDEKMEFIQVNRMEGKVIVEL